MTAELPADSDDKYPEQLAARFRDILDRHGFGFQYAVMQKICDVFERQRKWSFEVAEFPTTTGRFDTRIDFVIRPRNTQFFVACECKRANPALKDWCFIRAPYVRRNLSHERLIVDEVNARYSSSDPTRPRSVSVCGRMLDSLNEAYHIGLEVKNPDNKGDSHGVGGRTAIEDAAGQVCKGVNGLIATLAKLSVPKVDGKLALPDDRQITRVMPAIFTTAKLWVTDANLASADLATGKLPSDALSTMQARPWLFLQYATSPAIKHTLPTGPFGYELSGILTEHYTRTIAVVNADGIADFLHGFHQYS